VIGYLTKSNLIAATAKSKRKPVAEAFQLGPLFIHLIRADPR